MSDRSPVLLGKVVENLDNLRVPLSSAERSSLSKVYPYYGAQSIIDYVDRYIFDGTYILVAEDGENLRSQKKNVCSLVSGKFWVNNHAHIIKGAGGNDTHYLFYLLSLIDFKPYVTGSAQPKLTKDNLESIKLTIHQPTEQKRIASVLSTIDAKIELNQRLNEELEGMAKLLYDYWFVQHDFPMSAAQAAALGKPKLQGHPYRTSGGPMTYHPTLKREIPVGWEVYELGDLLSITRGASPRPIDDYLSESGIPWIKISDATASGNRFILETKQFIVEQGRKAARIVPPDTLILTNSATPAVPRITKIDAGVHDGWLVIENYTSGLTKDFMFHYFAAERPRIICLGSGSIFKNLKTDYIKGLKIVLPPKEMLNEASKHFESISDQIYNTTQQSQELTALRDWLLPMLMNGQVTVG